VFAGNFLCASNFGGIQHLPITYPGLQISFPVYQKREIQGRLISIKISKKYY
jgi:hypothetical protein